VQRPLLVTGDTKGKTCAETEQMTVLASVRRRRVRCRDLRSGVVPE